MGVDVCGGCMEMLFCSYLSAGAVISEVVKLLLDEANIVIPMVTIKNKHVLSKVQWPCKHGNNQHPPKSLQTNQNL